MLVYLIAETRITDVVQAHELIEAVRASVRHHQSIEVHREPGIAERLHRLRFAEHARSRRYQHESPVMRIDRIRNETVDWGGGTTVQTVCEDGVYQRTLKNG